MAIVCAILAIFVGRYIMVLLFFNQAGGGGLFAIALFFAVLVTYDPMDILWFFLAAITAYRVGSGAILDD